MNLIKRLPQDVLTTKLDKLSRMRPDLALLVLSGAASFTSADGDSVAALNHVGGEAAPAFELATAPIAALQKTASTPAPLSVPVPAPATPPSVPASKGKGSSASLLARVNAKANEGREKRSLVAPTFRSLLP